MDKKIFKYIFLEIARSRFIVVYTVILLLMSSFLIYFGGGTAKAVVSLLNVVLLIVPLVSIVFATIYYYGSREFIEFLLSQPVARKNIFRSEYLALSVTLSLGFFTGAGLPLIISGLTLSAVYLIITGIVLTFVFTAIALLLSVLSNDKVKGIGMSIAAWLYLSVIFDGLVLMIFYLFRDYPLNSYIIALTAMNPVDLSRILILLQADVSALMGYSGATFKEFFGSKTGMIVSIGLLIFWVAMPSYIALRKFCRKDF